MTEVKQSREEIIWGIASWLDLNIKARRDHVFGHDYSQLHELGKKILADNPNNSELKELLSALGDDPVVHAAGMSDALQYVVKGYCKYSSVYPTKWLKLYRDDVIEQQAADEIQREYDDRQWLKAANQAVDILVMSA